MSGFMLTRGKKPKVCRLKNSLRGVLCRAWPRGGKKCARLSPLKRQSSGVSCTWWLTVCKVHPVICILKTRAWNITYTIRHERAITTCQIEISSWKLVWKFNLFSSTPLMETHLICILFFPPCISEIHFKFLFPFPQRLPDIFFAVS